MLSGLPPTPSSDQALGPASNTWLTPRTLNTPEYGSTVALFLPCWHAGPAVHGHVLRGPWLGALQKSQVVLPKGPRLGMSAHAIQGV